MGRNVVCPDVCVGGEEGDVLRVLDDIYRCVRGDGYEYVDEGIGRRVSRDLRFVRRVRWMLMGWFGWGSGSDGPHSFNLFGYSFLLHIYASPIMHTQSPKQPLPTDDTPPSRPDKHVLITIILPLLQVRPSSLTPASN